MYFSLKNNMMSKGRNITEYITGMGERRNRQRTVLSKLKGDLVTDITTILTLI
jgi:hypothetical protein